MDALPVTPAPGEAGPSGSEGGTPTFDFERGYNELRPQFTRTTQELSSTRERLNEFEQLFEALHDSNPETQAAAMEALGLEIDSGSPGTASGEFTDPLEEAINSLGKRFDRLESARELEAAEREQQRLTETRDEFIGEAIGFIESSLNFKFTDREEEALGNLAIARADKDGVPDVQGAYNLLYGEQGVLETNRERWIANKLGAAQPPLGTTVPADQKPKNKAERVSYVDERMRALEQQQ